MIDDQDFIIELNHENINLLEEIIFQLPILKNQFGNGKASYEKKNNFFWEKITSILMDMMSYLDLVYDFEIKKIERKNI